jgi:hypothetical protein
MNLAVIKSAKGLLLFLAIAGCVEGTAVVTGQKRPAISPAQVQLYVEPPKSSYEVIALVNASSASGWTDQQSIDYAIDELKSQAAALGANGVILGQPGSKVGGFVMIEEMAIPYDEQTVSGRAIYVSR